MSAKLRQVIKEWKERMKSQRMYLPEAIAEGKKEGTKEWENERYPSTVSGEDGQA